MLVVGARPNLVKMAPIISALRRDGRLQYQLVHTGQHYDDSMSDIFFRELDLPQPDVNLGVGSGSHAAQTGAVMAGLERLVESRRPQLLITVGDVNSTLAAAIVAAKAGVPQAHVEAGLRSGDPHMPEEVNRCLTDRLADLLFTHSEEADHNLALEGVPKERVHFVGNVLIDSLMRLRRAWQGSAATAMGELPAAYAVVTLHRPSNVDDARNLGRIIQALESVAGEIPIVFPAHPRTRQRLGDAPAGKVRLVDPLGYLAFLDLVEHARFVLTDSGGIQEETTVLEVPCLTLRDSTERPVTVRLGTNRLIGADPDRIRSAVLEVLSSNGATPERPPLWDGRAAERIVPILADWLSSNHHLRLSA